MRRDNLVGTRGAVRSADSTRSDRYECLASHDFALSLRAATMTPLCL